MYSGKRSSARGLQAGEAASLSKFSVRYVPDVCSRDVTQRIIFNPNYGGKSCAVPGSCVIPIRERKIKPKFFEALRKSVAEKGFRNPILLYNTTDEGLLLAFGGSRLRVAKELLRPVPAIVVDYSLTYDRYDEVDEDNWQSYFVDEPELFTFTDVGVETHYSLERNRREHYDPAGMKWTEDYDGDKQFIKEEFPWL